MSSTDPQVLDAIVKAYDVRGTVPDQLNAEVAHALGRRLRPLRRRAADRSSAATCARPGPSWSTRSSAACIEQGVDVVDLGLASTDLVYFAAGTLDAPGRDVHRLAQPGAVQRRQVLPRRRPRRSGSRHRARPRSRPIAADGARRARPARRRRRPGSSTDAQPARRVRRPRACRSSTPSAMRPMRVVADTANGMGGLVVPGRVRAAPADRRSR